MTDTAIWLSEQDVVATVSLNDTIEALESGLRALASGEANNIPKALGAYGDGSSMHSLGSVLGQAGYCGYKNWVHTKRGAKAVFVLFDANKGSLLALLEANSLGQLRTAAMTGLGTRWLSPHGAADMALIGSGRQALMQVAAVHAVRPLSRLRVWSPTPEKRAAFAAELRSRFAFEVLDAGSLEEAAAGAGIVTLVTRAREPFLHASMLAPGAHLNAVGAILPGNAEFHQDVFGRTGFIAVDDLDNARKASRELIEHARWDRVHALGDVIAGKAGPVVAGAGLTLFKSVGMGLSDLSVARMVYERAIERGRGQAFPLLPAAPLRWEASR